MSTSKPIPQERRTTPSESAREFSSTLGRALFQQRIQKLLQSAIDSTGADGIAVSLLHGTEYICQASIGLAPEVGVPVKPGEGVCGRCLSERTTVVQGGIDGDIKSVVAVPTITNGRLQGLVAGFSLKESPFSVEAIAKFQRLADTVLEEVEPPLVMELNPENGDILEQMGFQPAELSVATEEDPNYLPEIVLEVLKETPSNAPEASEAETNEVLSELIGKREESLPPETMREVEKEAREIVDREIQQPPEPELASAKTEPEKQPAPESLRYIPAVPVIETPKTEKPFFHNTDPKRTRTTEDVLMDLVQQSLHVPAAPATAPDIEPTGVAGAQAAAPTAATAAIGAAPAVIKTPAEVSVNAPAVEAPKETLESIPEMKQERGFPVRTLIIGVAAMLIVAIGIFLTFYFRKPPIPAAQPSATVPTLATPAGTPISSAPQGTQAIPSKDPAPASLPEERTKHASTQSPQQQEPLMIAANGPPRRPAGAATDADATPLTSIAVNPSSIDLPSPSTNVVFGGRRSSGVIPAKLIYRVEPAYPAMARTMHLSGDVRMDITVTEDGHVKNVSNVNGVPLLAASAVEAVKKWRYAPARQDAKAVESTVEVTIRFR